MDYKFIGFLSTLFVGFTVLNRVLEGKFIESSDVSILNTMTISHSQSIYGLFSVPVLNTEFFFTGIPRLVKWDYSFFGGNAAIFEYMLYAITAAVSFGLLLVVIGLIGQYFSRR